MHGKTGGRFVKGNLWSTRTAKPGSDLLQGIAMAYRGSSVPETTCSIGQLRTKHARRGSPARRAGLPVGPISNGVHINRGNCERTWDRNPYFIPLAPPWVLGFIWKQGYLTCGWICFYLFSSKKKKKPKLPKHCQGLLPWKWPLRHKQAPALMRRDSRSEWALKWVKVLAFLNSVLVIKREGAQILNTQLEFRTVSDPSSPPLFQSISSEERKKKSNGY